MLAYLDTLIGFSVVMLAMSVLIMIATQMVSALLGSRGTNLRWGLETLGRVPRLVAGDAGFFSAANEKATHEKGVKRVCIPNRNTKSAERKKEQKKPWFREGQKWRTGCEGRISVVKRRHGLNRCRDKGEPGMKRWVGFGVIADNLINIGRFLSRAEKETAPVAE